MTNPLRPVINAALRVVCATRGHDTLLNIEPQRISLRCMTCGHETAGWTIGERVVSADGVTRRRVESTHAA